MLVYKIVLKDKFTYYSFLKHHPYKACFLGEYINVF